MHLHSVKHTCNVIPNTEMMTSCDLFLLWEINDKENKMCKEMFIF